MTVKLEITNEAATLQLVYVDSDDSNAIVEKVLIPRENLICRLQTSSTGDMVYLEYLNNPQGKKFKIDYSIVTEPSGLSSASELYDALEGMINSG